MRYQAIFFDADGVLIKNKFLFTEQLKKDYGIEIEKMLPFFNGVFRECSIGKADLKEELVNVIGDWGWKGTVEELIHFWFTKGTEIDEDVAAFVRGIRQGGVKTYMTTDQERYRGQHLRTTLGGGKLFDQVFYSAEIGFSKKDTQFFEYVCSRINIATPIPHATIVARDQILFVDDSETNLKTAKEFGLDVHLFTDLSNLKKYLAI